MALNNARLKTFLNVPRDLREWTKYLQQALENFANTLSTSDLTDITAAGAALVTAADLDAQKTLLGIGSATIDSGTYTPTLTNVTNLDASTAYQCQYMRVGNTVTVSGRVDVDPTAAAACELGLTLPIASDLGALEECAGVAFASGVAGQGAAIVGDAANDRASMRWVAVDLTNQPMYFSFSYICPDAVAPSGDTVTYTTGTAVTETVPGGKTSVVIKAWGGGGAGAGAVYSGHWAFSGGGGGGGGYSEKTISVAPGDTFTLTVADQVTGLVNVNGPDGNASTVTGTVSGGSVNMSAGGGLGGQLVGTGGVGGTASGGDTNTSGSAGAANGGAGGAAGGSGGGSGGSANGGSGSVPGGGGGGVNAASYSLPGGNGARGQVSFTYT